MQLRTPLIQQLKIVLGQGSQRGSTWMTKAMGCCTSKRTSFACASMCRCPQICSQLPWSDLLTCRQLLVLPISHRDRPAMLASSWTGPHPPSAQHQAYLAW